MAGVVDDVQMEDEEEIVDLRSDDVVTKYKAASDIANKTLGGIVAYCKVGMKATDVCAFGDTVIQKQCEGIFKSKKSLQKGVAFPTCLSVNEVVCHYSPLTSEADALVLKAGDVCKVDLGVHVDGFIAVTAHTFVIPGEDGNVAVQGRVADVLKAAYIGAEAAVKLIKPGATNKDITDILAQVGQDFGVSPLQGVLMHELKQFIIDGNNVIIGKEELEQKVDTFEFEDAHVYTVDVCMSTGAGKPIERDMRTTVFKRSVDQEYGLKMKASRAVFNEVNRRFATFPFTLRAFEDEKQARLGVVECVKHELFTPYPVLCEKAGDIVAHFKYTVLLLPSGTVKVTGIPVNMEQWQTDKVTSEKVNAVMALSTKKKKNKKKKKKNTAAAAAAGSEAMETD